jgi:L-malate glycosyltransferase
VSILSLTSVWVCRKNKVSIYAENKIMPLRVLFIGSLYPQTGRPHDGNFIREQALALQSIGVKVDVVCVEVRSLRDLSIDAVRQSHFQVIEKVENGLLTLRQKGWNPLLNFSVGGLIWSQLSFRLAEEYIARYGKPDVVHAHNALWAGHVASGLSKKYNIPFLVTEHSSNFLMKKVSWLEKVFVSHTYAQASEVVAVSSAHGLALTKYLDGRSPNIIPNVVDTDFFQIKAGEDKEDSFGFVAIGNLNRNKGFEFLLRAFADAIFTRGLDARLEIGGEGSLRGSLESLARSLNIVDRVRFLGRLSKQQVREAIWRANALVLSSTYETFGVVLIEALSSGVPVITTRCGGPEDIIKPSVGFDVSVGNIEEMSNTLTVMSTTSTFAPDKLREYAVQHFGMLAIAKQLEALYLEARA